MPRAAVRAEGRTEGTELEPSHMQLTRVFRRRHESADIRAPERDPRERGIDRDGNVRLQRLPRGVHVTRPEEGAIALHPHVSVTVEREGTLVWPVLLRPFPIHPDPRET